MANEPGSAVSKIPQAEPLILKAKDKEEMTGVHAGAQPHARRRHARLGRAAGTADRGGDRAQHPLPLALVCFNLGVELGQLAFIAGLFSLQRAVLALGVQPPRWVRLLPGYAVGSLGAFWTLQRLAPILAGR